jgi:hypothetical protein
MATISNIVDVIKEQILELDNFDEKIKLNALSSICELCNESKNKETKKTILKYYKEKLLSSMTTSNNTLVKMTNNMTIIEYRFDNISHYELEIIKLNMDNKFEIRLRCEGDSDSEKRVSVHLNNDFEMYNNDNGTNCIDNYTINAFYKKTKRDLPNVTYKEFKNYVLRIFDDYY